MAAAEIIRAAATATVKADIVKATGKVITVKDMVVKETATATAKVKAAAGAANVTVPAENAKIKKSRLTED